MIRRQRLLELERGLPDYGRSVRPEAHIARQLQAGKDYYYLIGTRALGVGVEKRWFSQAETAFRLYYPIAGHSPWRAAVALMSLLFVAAPPVILMTLNLNPAESVWAVGLTLLAFLSYAAFTLRTANRPGWQLRLLAWPYVVLQEIGLLLVSILRYATRTVTWKGRPVQARPRNRTHLSINE